MKMNDELYKILKYLCQVGLPALGSLYFALAQIWHFPYGEEVVGSIAAITTCLGIMLGISSYRYYKDAEDERN